MTMSGPRIFVLVDCPGEHQAFLARFRSETLHSSSHAYIAALIDSDSLTLRMAPEHLTDEVSDKLNEIAKMFGANIRMKIVENH